MKPNDTYLAAGKLRKAFTLIEVVLALGITSFAIIPLMGLMAVGLKTFSRSVDLTVQSQIVQSLLNEAQLADWKSLNGPAKFIPRASEIYFSDEGTEVSSADKAKATYTAFLSATDLTNQLTGIGILTNQVPAPTEVQYFTIIVTKNGRTDPVKQVRVILFNPGKL